MTMRCNFRILDRQILSRSLPSVEYVVSTASFLSHSVAKRTYADCRFCFEAQPIHCRFGAERSHLGHGVIRNLSLVLIA